MSWGEGGLEPVGQKVLCVPRGEETVGCQLLAREGCGCWLEREVGTFPGNKWQLVKVRHWTRLVLGRSYW